METNSNKDFKNGPQQKIFKKPANLKESSEGAYSAPSQSQSPHLWKQSKTPPHHRTVLPTGMAGMQPFLQSIAHPGNEPGLLLQQLAQPGGLLGEGVCIDSSQSLPEAQWLHLGVLGGCTKREKGGRRDQSWPRKVRVPNIPAGHFLGPLLKHQGHTH